MEILFLGEPMIEFNQTIPDGPYVQGFGGDTSNAAIAAARQGARVGFLGATGTDVFGDLFDALWRDEGVDTRAVLRMEDAPTGIYFVTHGPEGHVFSYRRAGSASSRYGVRHLPRDLLEQAKVLHVSAISQAISDTACDAVFEAIDIVRKAGGLVSYDTNLRLKLWPLAVPVPSSPAPFPTSTFCCPAWMMHASLPGWRIRMRWPTIIWSRA